MLLAMTVGAESNRVLNTIFPSIGQSLAMMNLKIGATILGAVERRGFAATLATPISLEQNLSYNIRISLENRNNDLNLLWLFVCKLQALGTRCRTILQRPSHLVLKLIDLKIRIGRTWIASAAISRKIRTILPFHVRPEVRNPTSANLYVVPAGELLARIFAIYRRATRTMQQKIGRMF